LIMSIVFAEKSVAGPRKVVAQRTYLHVSGLDFLGAPAREKVTEACVRAGVRPEEHFNIVRLDPNFTRISLLHYPNFFDVPFPELRESWSVDLEAGQASYRTYVDSLNPPILHRKELLLPESHPRLPEYAELTAAAESIGLFDEPTRIGFREQWYELIREKGYKVVGHQLVPVGNDESAGEVPIGPEPLALGPTPVVASVVSEK
jgi:DNA phosphorothioation-associated putative methyltransferase